MQKTSRASFGCAAMALETFYLVPRSQVRTEQTTFEKIRASRRLLDTIDSPLIKAVREISGLQASCDARAITDDEMKKWDLRRARVRGRVFKPQHLTSTESFAQKHSARPLLGASVNTRAAHTNTDARTTWHLFGDGDSKIPHAVTVVLNKIPHIFWHEMDHGLFSEKPSFSPRSTWNELAASGA